jgi:hypothetical protein
VRVCQKLCHGSVHYQQTAKFIISKNTSYKKRDQQKPQLTSSFISNMGLQNNPTII